MTLDRFAQQSSGIERRTVGGCDNSDLALRDDRHFRDRNAKQIRMNRPKAGRQCAQLNAFYAALFEKRDWILKVVVCVLGAIGSEDSPGRHWFAVNGFNDAELV